MHLIGVRLHKGLLHRVAAAHKRVRKLLWPVLIRRTPFKRVVQISSAETIASLISVVPINEAWSVVILPGRDRAFVDRTYDFNHGRLSLKGAFVATFSHAYVHTVTGLVCTADGELVADSVKKVERHVDTAIGVNLSTKRLLAGEYATVMTQVSSQLLPLVQRLPPAPLPSPSPSESCAPDAPGAADASSLSDAVASPLPA